MKWSNTISLVKELNIINWQKQQKTEFEINLPESGKIEIFLLKKVK